MSKIFYKLKSRKDFDFIVFDGYSLSVFDLKREIILNKKLGKGPEFDIALDDAQTGEEYADDNFQIPKNSSVIVRVIPATPYRSAQRYLTGSSYVPKGSQLASSRPAMPMLNILPTTNSMSTVAAQSSIAPLQNQPVQQALASTSTIQGETEADKIQSLFQQSDDLWKKDSLQIAMSQTQKGLGRRPNQSFGAAAVQQQQNGQQKKQVGDQGTAAAAAATYNPYGMEEMREPPPVSDYPCLIFRRHYYPAQYYVCFRCGVKGHWLKFCPTHGNKDYDNFRVKKTTGIPRTFLKGLVDNQPVSAVPPQKVVNDANISLSDLMANVGEGHTVMVTPEGELVIAKINTATFDRLTAGSSTVISPNVIYQQLAFLESKQTHPPNTFIPLHLKCNICGLLVRDAVKAQCCQSLYCDQCIRGHLMAQIEQQAAAAASSGTPVPNSAPCSKCSKPIDIDRIIVDKPSRALADQHLRNIVTLIKDMANAAASPNGQEAESSRQTTVLEDLETMTRKISGFELPPGGGLITTLDTTEERAVNPPPAHQHYREPPIEILLAPLDQQSKPFVAAQSVSRNTISNHPYRTGYRSRSPRRPTTTGPDSRSSRDEINGYSRHRSRSPFDRSRRSRSPLTTERRVDDRPYRRTGDNRSYGGGRYPEDVNSLRSNPQRSRSRDKRYRH